ncbi:hypothetical protein EHS13_19435 [Paenibacillus psychroresistens]|uniref:Uncharacterized protein n=2 Tax=Paenibacillus psychroresistens TaxID=1778678 RepID=A0A6B8RMJ3_9BACL|nr:hypothetical protein EHS13_19435 [Paenibacillus psychroresistens]
MNPGYMTVVVLLSIGILLGSGWKDYFFKGLSYKSIVLFVAAWLIGSLIKLRLHVHGLDLQLNMAFTFLLLFSVFLLIRLKSALERLNLLTIGLMLCILDFTLREASGLPMEYIAICLAIVVTGLQKRLDKQLASLLLGFLCGNVLSLLAHQNSRLLILADQSYQDLWWLTLLFTRVFVVLYENGIAGFRKWVSVIFEKK